MSCLNGFTKVATWYGFDCGCERDEARYTTGERCERCVINRVFDAKDVLDWRYAAFGAMGAMLIITIVLFLVDRCCRTSALKHNKAFPTFFNAETIQILLGSMLFVPGLSGQQIFTIDPSSRNRECDLFSHSITIGQLLIAMSIFTSALTNVWGHIEWEAMTTKEAMAAQIKGASDAHVRIHVDRNAQFIGLGAMGAVILAHFGMGLFLQTNRACCYPNMTYSLADAVSTGVALLAYLTTLGLEITNIVLVARSPVHAENASHDLVGSRRVSKVVPALNSGMNAVFCLFMIGVIIADLVYMAKSFGQGNVPVPPWAVVVKGELFAVAMCIKAFGFFVARFVYHQQMHNEYAALGESSRRVKNPKTGGQGTNGRELPTTHKALKEMSEEIERRPAKPPMTAHGFHAMVARLADEPEDRWVPAFQEVFEQYAPPEEGEEGAIPRFVADGPMRRHAKFAEERMKFVRSYNKGPALLENSFPRSQGE